MAPWALSAQEQAPLSSIDTIHRLASQEAAHKLGVQVRGTVTSAPGSGLFYIQSGTAAVSVHLAGFLPEVGSRLEVFGVTDPGMFATGIQASAVRVFGAGTLPPARPVTYAQLYGGAHDGELVSLHARIEGLAPAQSPGAPGLHIDAESQGHRVEVEVAHLPPDAEARLVDAEVSLRGVAATRSNLHRQFGGVRLLVNSLADIRILQPAPADPWKTPPSTLGSVLQYGSAPDALHRVHVAGVVTFAQGRSAYIEDRTGSLRVEAALAPAEHAELAPGTTVDAVGFPATADDVPYLASAVVRPASVAAPPVRPLAMHAGDLQQKVDGVTYYPYDGRLLTLSGEVASQRLGADRSEIVLRDGDTNLYARWPRDRVPTAKSPDVGSLVRVTGVLQVRLINGLLIYRIQLRDASDLVLVKAAPWWGPEHTLWLLSALLLLAALSVLWVLMLRHRVRVQTRLLRESQERFRHQAQSDALTGVASRAFLQERLPAAIEYADRTGSQLGIILIDLDHFKAVNDTLGHHVGDRLLCAVATRIREAVRHTDLVVRMGGDEFIVLLPSLSTPADAELIGHKILASLAAPVSIGGERQLTISASIGVCHYPDGGSDWETLLQNVDAAMYRSKSGGRNSCSVHTVSREHVEVA